MAEKRERQRGCSSNAPEARADRPLNLAEVVRAEVGQFAPLDVAPHEFGRIEIGRVARQALDGEPRALSLQVRRHGTALMRRQTIPDQDETPTAKMTLELVQEADERDVVVTARPRLEEEAAAAEVPSERQAHGEGELRPVEGMDQDGGLPARGPRAADGRPLRDAALVLENDPGPATPSVFLPRASVSSPSAGWRSHSAPSHVWLDAAASSRARPGGATHGPGDTSRPSRA
jgi:hypothetical protein